MNEHEDFFSGFALLTPSAEESDRAVASTRDVILAAAAEESRTAHGAGVRSLKRSMLRVSGNGRARSRRFGPVVYWGVATVACAVVVCVAFSLLNSAPALAWSDVVQGMIGAKSLRCISEVKLKEGNWARAWDVTYDEQRGYMESSYDREGVESTSIDNGESHWILRRGQSIATRQSTLSVELLLNKLLDPVASDPSLTPEPEKDEVVDGVRYRCFTTTDATHESRQLLWVNADKRLRHSRHERLVDGEWLLEGRISIEYDIATDGMEFKPQFDESVRIVDLAKLFEEAFPLERAVHQEEKFGYIFAIHELKRLGDYEYYLLISFRPTEETRKKIALEAGQTPGNLFPTFRATVKSPVEQETLLPLARAGANGVEVSAYFGELRGFELRGMTRARPKFQLNANAKLWKDIGAFNDVEFNLPLPDGITTRDEVVRSLYETISTLEAVPMNELCFYDRLDDRKFTDSESHGFGTWTQTREHMLKPSEITYETFLQHLEKMHSDSRAKTSVESK